MNLDARKQKILQVIVQDYIASAEPVGSRTIARKYDLGISPATIRNEMFDLEMMGYLEQPHTSAGRVPSLKGYRLYVDCLLKPTKITEAEKQFVQSWFQDKLSSVDEIFQSTAKLLARITHNVTLIMASERLNSKLKYIRFLPLDDRRAIMIVVTDTGQVENCIYPKPSGASMDDLNIIAQKLTNYLTGTAMDRIDEKAIETFHETIVDDVELYRLAFRAMEQTRRQGEHFYKGGTTELLNKPEFKDVDKAKSELLGIINDITSEMKDVFLTHFRQIDECFRQTFLELFGGGKAALVLEDENNVLECGIEIKVQPPGKALSNISLLSGGEMAFVAIALYFAILKVRPTPFCVMDEIEAALDEANVTRYAEYMRRMSDKTQFLVITHRRGTMEEADMLYGVTMQEKGVSTVIELDLENAQKTIEE